MSYQTPLPCFGSILVQHVVFMPDKDVIPAPPAHKEVLGSHRKEKSPL